MNRLLTALYVVAWVLLACWAAHAETRTPHVYTENRIQESINEIETIRGGLIDGKILGTADNMFTNVRFQPYYRPLLYDQTVLFCGFVDQFNGMTGLVEVKFNAVSHRMFEGVGCHDLISVEKWTPPPQKGW